MVYLRLVHLLGADRMSTTTIATSGVVRRPRHIGTIAMTILAALAGGLTSVALTTSGPSSFRSPGVDGGAPPRVAGAWTLVPAVARLAVARALANHDPAYWAHAGDQGVAARNPAQRLRIGFGTAGPVISTAAGQLALSLRAIGGRSVPSTEPVANRSRVSYRHGPVTEWYANTALGLEQGFDVARPVPGGVRLSLAVGGSLRPAMHAGALELRGADGSVALRYGQLAAYDARGRRLASTLRLVRGRLTLRVDTTHAHYPVRIDPLVQQAQLTASDGTAYEGLPNAVAQSGDTIAIGVTGATVGGNLQGAVYVFEKPASGWANATQTAELIASDASVGGNSTSNVYGDALGTSVAISGDTIVSGAPRATSGGRPYAGQVYVFQRPAAGHWLNSFQSAELVGSDVASYDYLGSHVATDGSTIAVGSPIRRRNGAVYVYPRPGANWTSAPQTAILTASDGAAGDTLGSGLAVVGDTIFAGAPYATVAGHAGEGAVYVFVRPGSAWTSGTQTAKLTPSVAGPDESLGWALASDGTTLVAGAPNNYNPSASIPESAYVWVKPSGGWTTSSSIAARLTQSDAGGVNHFGQAVGLSSTGIAVGAPFVGSNGGVYYYAKPAGGWANATETSFGAASSGGLEQGNAVALTGSTLVAGAQYATAGGHAYQGAAYVFDASGTATTVQTSSTTTTAATTTTSQSATTTTTTFANPGGANTITFTSTAPPPIELTWGDIAAGLFGITPRSGQTVNLGQFVFVAACKPGQTCNGTAVFAGFASGGSHAVRAARARTVTYARAKFSLRGGTKRSVTFTVTSAGRTLLKRRHKLVGTVTVVVSRKGTTTNTLRHAFTLRYTPKPPKRRRHR